MTESTSLDAANPLMRAFTTWLAAATVYLARPRV
jgi:hypothetical protein